MMADTRAMSVRGIEPELYRWLKIRAAKHERSLEAEARAIFAEAKRAEEDSDEGSLGAWFDVRLERTNGFDELEIPRRTGSPARRADFTE